MAELRVLYLLVTPVDQIFVALVLLVLPAMALQLIATTPFPAPDELQHVSYVAFLQETGRLLPRYEDQKTLHEDDFRRWDPRPNYVGHPSPFYLFETAFLDRSMPPFDAVLPLRLASLVLLGAGIGVALLAGFRCFRDDPLALLLFCAALVLCPNLLGVSRQVTNDSLALLGGGLAYWGATAVGRRGAALAIGLGLMFALWAKPNAGLAVGIFVAVVIGLADPGRLRLLLAAGAGGLLGVVPYVFIVARYGAIVPVTAESLEPVRKLASFAEYLPTFLFTMGLTWGSVRFPRWPIAGALDWLTIAGFWAIVLCLAFAARQAWRRPGAPGGAVAVAAPLAFAIVVPIHLWFAATRLGYSWPASSFRYELPLWPAMAHGLGYAVANASGRATRVAIVAATGAALACAWAG